jgi:hypothetical protein
MPLNTQSFYLTVTLPLTQITPLLAAASDGFFDSSRYLSLQQFAIVNSADLIGFDGNSSYDHALWRSIDSTLTNNAQLPLAYKKLLTYFQSA